MPLLRLRGLIWPSNPHQRRQLHCRLGFSLPFGALAGLAYAHLLPGDPVAAWIPVVAFTAFMLLQQILEPLVTAAVASVGGDAWEATSGFLWDAVSGGVVGWFVTRVLGAPTVPAVAVAGTVGAIYALAAGYLVCGSGVGDFLSLLLGTRGSSTPYRPQHSQIDALAASGQVQEAVTEYRRIVDAEPRALAPYLRLARLLRTEVGDYEGAAKVLRDAFERADTTAVQDLAITRRLADLWRADVGEPRRAAPDLARLVDRWPDGDGARWARRELAEIKEELARDLGVEPDEG